MKKSIFTPEFYEKMYEVIVEAGDDALGGFMAERICDGESIYVEGYVDEYFFNCYAHFTTEVDDRSFDHAFGTWHDPYPSIEIAGCDDISDVQVMDGDETEIEGFDYDAFMAQLEKDSYCGFKAGMKVLYACREEVEWLAYNTVKDEFKIRYADGHTRYVNTCFIKKIKATAV